jgi:hypothetical protein
VQISLTLRTLLPIIAIALGVAAVVTPRFLNYIVAVFLVLYGLQGLGVLR